MKTLGAAIATAGLLLAANAGAGEWWSPQTRKCPTFDTKEACIAWCDENRTHCRWVKSCHLHTGDDRPSCPNEAEKD